MSRPTPAPPLPAPRPCASCPYRRDVPSGVWAAEEYAKLPRYDDAVETWEQPVGVFHCHQRDQRICAGWAAVSADEDTFALRIAVSAGHLSPEQYDAVLDYTTDVPLFATGAQACEHGMAEIENPGPEARRLIDGLEAKRGNPRKK